MSVRIRFVDNLPEPDAYRALMVDYFRGIVELIVAAGGPRLAPEELATKTIAQIDQTLPPKGRLAFALDDEDRLLGTGAFRLIDSQTAEFKRMFVRPEAQRMGIGRTLFEARLAEAKAIGCRRIVADTVRGNTPMLALYETYRFRRVPRYEGNFNAPELDPFLDYLELILSGDE